MKRKQPIINSILILILLLLLGWGGYSLLQTKYPSIVKLEDAPPSHRTLEVPSPARQAYSNAVVGDVTRLNLFRKERKKYYLPKPPKPKPRPRPQVAKATPPQPPPPPPKPLAPPPQLILTGVVLLNGKQVAIFDGTYSEIRDGKLVDNLKPRRRGYKIGETLGGYKIEKIERTHATLTEIAGNRLTLKVSKSSPMVKIQKSGSQLSQKGSQPATVITAPSRPPQMRRPGPIPIQPGPRVPPPLRVQPPAGVPSPPLPGDFQAVPDPSNPDSPPQPPQANPIPPLRQKAMGF